MFLAKSYAKNEAVVDIPTGSAKLKYAGAYPVTDYVVDDYTVDFQRNVMHDKDGNVWADGCVQVIEKGTGFDGCEFGTIAYDNGGEVKAAYDAGKTSSYIIEGSRPTYEKYVEENSSYISEDYEWIISLKTGDEEVYSWYLDYYNLSDGFTQDDFNKAYYNMRTSGTYSESITDKCWYYACYGGGCAYVGPFYLYSYKTTTFTADDIVVVTKPGFEIPEEETVVTIDDVVVQIKIDGVTYEVPSYTISPEDNKLGTKENDLTIGVTVGGVTKTVTVAQREAGEVKKEAKVSESSPIKEASIANTIDELKDIGAFTEEELTEIKDGEDANVWIEVDALDESKLDKSQTEAIKEKVAKEIGESAVLTYFDVNMFKQIGEADKTQIHNVNKAIKVMVKIPDNLISTDTTVKREYKIVRYHDGAAEIIDGSFDETTHMFTFETDKFSTYAIVYEDEAVEVKTEEPKTEEPKEDVKTGAGSFVWLWAVVMGTCAGAAATTLVYNKKRKMN